MGKLLKGMDMGVRAEPVRMEIVGETPTQLRTEIARLDQEASVLRNRSQITPKTRARIATLRADSARLSATLPASAPANVDLAESNDEFTSAQFTQGHALYLRHQAPALARAHSSLQNLTQIGLPPPLERDIIALKAKLDHHTSEMTHFNPSQGLPPAMKRLLFVHTGKTSRKRCILTPP